MNARELVNNAWVLSGIVSREWETVSGSQGADGLQLLNELLDKKSINGILIPYYTHFEFDSIVGQETYNIPNLIDLRTLTFNIDTVRYPMRRDMQKQYFGTGRVDDIQSLPFHYYGERSLGGMIIYLYFVPSQVFQMKVTGKFSLANVALDDELDATLDPFYQRYLKYALAKNLCDFYGYPWEAQKNEELRELEYKITDLPGVDLSINKNTAFGRRTAFRYGQANLGRGWEP